MDIPNLLQILPAMIAAVERAGALLAAECVRPDGRRGFGDKADIDVEIEIQLRAELLAILNCDWWGEDTGRVLTGNPWCWVVDPNDGTSDFLKGLKGSAVSVGLLHNNRPVLGVVYAPVTPSGTPDLISWADGMDHLIRNGTKVVVDLSLQMLSAKSMVMVSAAAGDRPQINRELCAPADFYPMPSIAYRLARVSAGDGLCGISLYPVSCDALSLLWYLKGPQIKRVLSAQLVASYADEYKCTPSPINHTCLPCFWSPVYARMRSAWLIESR
ncbi:inositol monophosphatase [Pseudomonas sp. CFBP 8770]|uniref:inositol monophosphatase family protein n=1 Tax=unclassified Pseudomonas TaxID=196821 RepID=UPI00177B94EB|nr:MULTISPECIES: inositol monophosphatase family protein [unclassified Pseudomonas]MBD8472483.1 inositol monophosphatase [Pseudomonas sp. CFBP 8773]MBD8649272.1 inositol monophosphatase [Pseudomonas sp. CFBP 8770]